MIIRPSPNHNERPPGTAVTVLVLHYTGMESCDIALERLCDETAQVSAHYLIDEDGSIYQLVDEDRRAWHAGVASWRGIGDINACSIGIELVNPGHEFGYRNFPEEQMMSLIDLSKGILSRHNILPHNVVGHSDIAPTRKEDPGELFDWQRLAGEGIGQYPDLAPYQNHGMQSDVNEDHAQQTLHKIGYDVADFKAAVRAFQRRYRPSKMDGVMDQETTNLVMAVFNLG